MKEKTINAILFVIMLFLLVIFLFPIGFILINSFKGKFFISDSPFSLPKGDSFAGLENYVSGLARTGFFQAAGWSFFITIISVAVVVLFSAMTAYYLTRVKNKFTQVIYYLFVFSMIVPFQMVMFPTIKVADMLHLNNPIGMVVLYLGFGSGLSVFMFAGFIKSIPIEIEEASMIDGCSPIKHFFYIILPILKPTAITVAILNTMWIWNDYLLPYLVIGVSTPYKTIPVVIQMLVGSNGNKDLGAMMAMLVLSMLPVIVFYLTMQKHIVKGVAAGAIKG
ncbi:carbohydrate ABC transporter permease [Anaerococcus hydrogenalis]|uniref:ABC transporter, permease protein n=3 Tax=Anaerococcus hydrogenalis TaxID=33029 RepID=F0H2I1_9FIRM|nr:carbohydrate ABC transporter permease [Anaerococcus hydrogenalis]MDU6063865.1 carbohydrate ABC transporter permease [Anaerococcus sp.]EEB35904.1 ABC transporter, permease protein [Anaerococcus hydrogenalis DSM 7454]EGC83318.1 ABC transporter, permease protein [Anaerococcus hydrogenalis ACS-025-V-Sch4]MBS5988445.1 carbohydrate ABC transporter permease [Anaerococcus hydrogenalis]MDK7695270.1 carbohydrate ABC transporter permease [Anaerococcus hydrogenalis]